MSLGFYAEERSEPEKAAQEAEARSTESELPSTQTEEHADEFEDASDVEPTPMDEDELESEAQSSPVPHRASSRPRVLGMSMTPSPVKKQHFVGLTPMPRRPRLSLTTRRKVSLRTRTLLNVSEAYSDRLFLPPPPPSPATTGMSGLSKSMSMPSNLSAMAPIQPLSALDASSSLEEENEDGSQADSCVHEEQQEADFEERLDPALSEEEEVAEPWKDSDDDEDEVDQSLSVASPSPKKAPAYLFSPVKTSALPKFATPQPMSKRHERRISMPPAGASDGKPSMRAALVRLQISGAGERTVHKPTAGQKSHAIEQTSPLKSRKVVRVSDVGLAATELSMGFDVLQDSPAEQDSEKIAEALNDLFTAEEEEVTDDELLEDDEEEERKRSRKRSFRSAPRFMKVHLVRLLHQFPLHRCKFLRRQLRSTRSPPLLRCFCGSSHT